jgi:hypothetical protein
LAPELGLQVERVDVASEEGAAVAVAAGAPFPPAVLADGELVGFGRMSERRLRRVLQRRLTLG